MQEKSVKNSKCCFLGHRKIEVSAELRQRLYEIIENLIINKGIYSFLFGSRSEFDELCYSVVTELKGKYPHIARIYVRAEFPDIADDYEKYLLELYDETYFPESIINAGKAIYVERNYIMIDKSSFCIFYYDKNFVMKNSKSGTGLAYEYAVRKKKNIINIACR